MRDEFSPIIQKHNTDLHANSERAGGANKSNHDVSGSTDKINEAEKIMAKLLSDLQVFEANQVSVFASQKAEVDQLTSETETALASLDGKLTATVAGTQQEVITEFGT